VYFWLFGIFFGHLVFIWPFGIFYGRLVYFMAVWYILWTFGIFVRVTKKKSGNPVRHSEQLFETSSLSCLAIKRMQRPF
jgi:uncharacterized membrane protein YcfT